MSYPRAATSRGSRPLTVPFVASGTKAGVRTSPWAVAMTPARAREAGSRASMVNRGGMACDGRSVLAAIVDVARVGLPVMVLLIAAESMGLPLPGETALIAAAVLAGRGHFPIEAVIVLAATAAIIGDNLGFALSRRYGRSVV